MWALCRQAAHQRLKVALIGSTEGTIAEATDRLCQSAPELTVVLSSHGFLTPEAEAAWTQHVVEAGAKILRTQANSWFVGANIPGKARFLLTSPDSAPVMRAKRAEVAAKGYAGFLLQ